jgi:multidrug efflux system membrane fusion protein
LVGGVVGAARQFGWYSSQASAPRAAPPAVPVRATAVRRQDVPIVLPGFGTVQAFNSVLVKSRVDGQIIKINFTEGQNVHAGDVLVEIDAAPFQATLAQAQATKLKDEAQLENARLDLERSAVLPPPTPSANSRLTLPAPWSLSSRLRSKPIRP